MSLNRLFFLFQVRIEQGQMIEHARGTEQAQESTCIYIVHPRSEEETVRRRLTHVIERAATRVAVKGVRNTQPTY